MKSVWVIFSIEERNVFPNFVPIGAYSSREGAEKQISVFPKGQSYQLFELPINQFFGEITKDGQSVECGLGRLKHFHYESDEE